MREAQTGVMAVRAGRRELLLFLEFLYTGTISKGSLAGCGCGCTLWQLADIFNVPSFRTWLARSLDAASAIPAAHTALHFNSDELLSACARICANTSPLGEHLAGFPASALAELVRRADDGGLRLLWAWCVQNPSLECSDTAGFSALLSAVDWQEQRRFRSSCSG